MATLSAILVMDGVPGNSGSQTTGASTAQIFVGNRRLIAINADQDVRIRWGSVSGPSAVSTDFRIPANQTFTLDSGDEHPYFSLFNGSGVTANYSWAYLSKF